MPRKNTVEFPVLPHTLFSYCFIIYGNEGRYLDKKSGYLEKKIEKFRETYFGDFT